MTVPVASRKRGALIALAIANFASVYAMVAFSPVLGQLSDEFAVPAGTAGLTLTAFTLPGVAVGLAVGPLMDRRAPRPFLVFAGAMTGTATVLGALAPSFELLLLSRFAAGIGAAMLTPSAGALIGDLFEIHERGRAFSVTYGANAVANVLGLPIAGILGAATSWRFATASVGLLSLVAAACVAVVLPAAVAHASEDGRRSPYGRILRDRSALAMLAVTALAAMLMWSWTTYLVVYFQHSFGLSQELASVLALTSGLGVLIGSQFGGRLSDRVGHRNVVIAAGLASALVLPVLASSRLEPIGAAGLNLLLLTILGARSTAQAALIATQAPGSRATMFALAGALSSGAIALAAATAGGLLDAFGFETLGLFGAGAGLLAVVLVIGFVRKEPRPTPSTAAALVSQ